MELWIYFKGNVRGWREATESETPLLSKIRDMSKLTLKEEQESKRSHLRTANLVSFKPNIWLSGVVIELGLKRWNGYF